MTELVLVRHGETVWHTDNRYAGSSDVALTELGLRQAAVLADWAVGAGLTAVWSSTLSRARATAAASAERTGLPLRTEARLGEVDFGEGEGRTRAEMRRLWPERIAAFERDPVAHHLPGGEDPRAAAARAVDALTAIAAADPEGRALVVAHGTLIRLVLCHFLGIPAAEYRRVFPSVRNTALTRLRLADGRGALLEYNAPLGGTGATGTGD